MSIVTCRLLLQRLVGTTLAILFGFSVAYLAMLHMGLNLKQWDFLYYYSGSHLTVVGKAGSVFNLQAISAFERHLASPLSVRNGGLPYLYPPFLAIALSPLAALPYNAAYLLWLALDSAFLAITVVLLEDYAALGPRARTLLRAAAICSLPIVVAILQGQTSILILLAVTAAFLALRSGREVVGGALLSLLLIKPPYLLPLLIVLAVRKHWRAVISLATTSVSLFVLAACIFGPRGVRDYFQTMIDALSWRSGQVGGFDPVSTRSFPGFVQLLAPGTVSTVATIIFAAAVLAFLAFCSLRSEGLDLPWALAVVSAVLISPHVLVHDLSLLLLPVLISLRYARLGPAHLKSILAVGYVAITAGFAISYIAPVQLSVFAEAALGAWLAIAALCPASAPQVGRSQLMPSAGPAVATLKSQLIPEKGLPR